MKHYDKFVQESGVLSLTFRSSFDQIAMVLTQIDNLFYRFDQQRARKFLANRVDIDVNLLNVIQAELSEAN